MGIGTLAIRGTVGPLFVGHGTQKLFGWFDGHGLDATTGGFESMGLRPGRRHALAAGVSEALGGVLLTVGALTPVAAGMLTGVMTTAIRKVHAPNGPWASSGGWEYNAVLIGLLAAVAESGPGPLSVDGRAWPGMRGPLLAAAAIGAGVAGSYLVTGPLNAPAEAAPAEPAGATGDVPARDGSAQPSEATIG